MENKLKETLIFLKKKAYNWIEQKRKQKSERKHRKLINKIRREMPFLTYYNGNTNRYDSEPEQIKTYFEIKGIKSQKGNNKIIAVLTFFIVLLTGLQLYTNIFIFKPYYQSIEPEIEIFTNSLRKIPELSGQFMADKRFLPGETLELCIKNKGKTETGHIYLSLKENWTSSMNYNFESIGSGDYACKSSYIREKTLSSENNGDINSIPEGLINLEFIVKCDNCNPQFFSRLIPVCIWKKDSTICNYSPTTFSS